MNKHDLSCESLMNVPGVIRRVRLFGFEDFEKKKPTIFFVVVSFYQFIFHDQFILGVKE